MSATGLVVCQGTALLEVRTEVPTPVHEDGTRCFVLFSKSRTEECLVCRTSSHGQAICLCTQLQSRHVMPEVITGSDPAAIQVGIFHSG